MINPVFSWKLCSIQLYPAISSLFWHSVSRKAMKWQFETFCGAWRRPSFHPDVFLFARTSIYESYLYRVVFLVHTKSHQVVSNLSLFGFDLFFGTTPHPVTVNTRIIPFLVGNPYKPSFVTAPGWGGNPTYSLYFLLEIPVCQDFDAHEDIDHARDDVHHLSAFKQPLT